MLDTAEAFGLAFVNAWMARDGAALAALFAEDADFVNVVGIWWEDRKAIEKAHQYALDSFFGDSRLSLARVKQRVLGPDHVLLHLRLRLSGQRTPQGQPAADRTTILSVVLERRDNGWLAVSAQNTDIVLGAETFVASKDGLSPQDYRD